MKRPTSCPRCHPRIDDTIHVTECIIGPEAARTRTWTCSRTDQPHLNLRHQGQPEQPARFDNQGDDE